MFVGNGISKLLERSVPLEKREEETLRKITQMFLSHYDNNNTVSSSPYPGITDLLSSLQEMGCLIAVASNKYQRATEKLVKHYFPQIKFCCVLGQRENIAVKPDPQIVYDIISAIGITDKSEILYIGDSGVDMKTANNSGVDSCGVTWGFRNREELILESAKHIVDNPIEILKIIA